METPTGESVLLVGGTASITGEESRHPGDLQEQSLETFRNLASVVASAVGTRVPEDATVDQLRSLLASFQDIRVYHPNKSDGPMIDSLVRKAFPAPCRIELFQASLCRPELLIEIEGLAMPNRGAGLSTFSSP